MSKEEIIKYIFDEENYSNFISSQNGGEQYYILLEKEESKILKDYISNLQDRIDKTIEYIEKYKTEDYCDGMSAKQLLDILKGE